MVPKDQKNQKKIIKNNDGSHRLQISTVLLKFTFKFSDYFVTQDNLNESIITICNQISK